jgi:SWI/SNF-related matrix-associated actin-dependent regulator 1 of chromatin subfamily A
MSNFRICLGTTGHIELHFPFDEFKDEMHNQFYGAMFNWASRCWRVPYQLKNIHTARSWARKYMVRLEPENWDRLITYEEETLLPLYRQSLALSPRKPLGAIPGMQGKLYPFQEAAVEYALTRKCCFIADDMGAGKSVEALAAIAVGYTFPAIVVCPSSLVLNWNIEVEKWFPSWPVQILRGDSIQPGKKVYILGYSRLKKYAGLLGAMKPKCIIFDESHRLKGYDSQQTILSTELAKGIPYRFLITGTPVINRPSDLMSQLKVLGRWDVLINVRYFSEFYCGAMYDFGYKTPKGADHLSELDEQLRLYCMIRRGRDSLLPYLPKSMVAPVYLEPDTDTSDGWPSTYYSRLQEIEQLRRNSFAAKRQAIINWIDDSIQSDGKMVVFGYFSKHVEDLAARFSAPVVTGDISPEKILKTIDAFQADPAAKLLFLTYSTGGQGWKFDMADRVALMELDWSDSTHKRAEGRLVGPDRKKPIQIYRLLVRGSYEENYMLNIIDKKKKITDELLGE